MCIEALLSAPLSKAVRQFDRLRVSVESPDGWFFCVLPPRIPTGARQPILLCSNKVGRSGAPRVSLDELRNLLTTELIGWS